MDDSQLHLVIKYYGTGALLKKYVITYNAKDDVCVVNYGDLSLSMPVDVFIIVERMFRSIDCIHVKTEIKLRNNVIDVGLTEFSEWGSETHRVKNLLNIITGDDVKLTPRQI